MVDFGAGGIYHRTGSGKNEVHGGLALCAVSHGCEKEMHVVIIWISVNNYIYHGDGSYSRYLDGKENKDISLLSSLIL